MPKPLIVIPGDIDQSRGYRINKWKTYDNYECIFCQYATIYLQKMEKHQAESTHPWAYPGQYSPEDPTTVPATEPEY